MGAVLYVAMLLLAGVIAMLRGTLQMPTWDASTWLSVALGVLFAAIVCALTELLLRRSAHMRAMRREFRGFVSGASRFDIAVLAAASGIAEECLFRGALQPWLGLALTSVLFGAVHFVPTRALILWSVWAGLVGFMLGLIVTETNVLLGAVVAHVLINAVNLRRIARFDPSLDEVEQTERAPALVGRKRSRSQG